MATIDKTYCYTWEDYQEVVKWASEFKFTCPNGIVLDPSKYIYEWEEKYFDGDALPIMNTPQELDYFLIKYCPIELVQDRMREVYSEEYYKAIKDGTSEYDKFVYPEIGTKARMIKDSKYHNRKPFSIYNSYINKHITYVSVEVHYNGELCWYNETNDRFLLPYELGTAESSCADLNCKSLKAIVRKIRKWKLPKGAIVDVMGRYIGEEWKFKIE